MQLGWLVQTPLLRPSCLPPFSSSSWGRVSVVLPQLMGRGPQRQDLEHLAKRVLLWQAWSQKACPGPLQRLLQQQRQLLQWLCRKQQ